MAGRTLLNKIQYEDMPIIPEVKVFKALGEENRIRAVLALKGRELCVCQIVELLQLAHSTVSRHMSILKEAGLVQSFKRGRWVYYRLRNDESAGFPKVALRQILSSASNTQQARIDSERLQELLMLNPEELCERQKGC